MRKPKEPEVVISHNSIRCGAKTKHPRRLLTIYCERPEGHPGAHTWQEPGLPTAVRWGL